MATKVINGRTFELKPIPAMQSFALQPILAPVVGQVLGLLLRVFGGDDEMSLEKLDLNAIEKLAPAIAPQLGTALGSVKPAELMQIARGLLGGATCDGVPLWPTGEDKRFNELFAGRTRDLWPLLWFAVQENYPDFLPARAGSAAPSPGESPSATSTTSPGAGPSTGSSARA